ncbi:WD40 repeat-like protein [Suillus brevipes Sb2]|nr:WD40 repeat-like protein [Suillus brevipes Sb2]
MSFLGRLPDGYDKSIPHPIKIWDAKTGKLVASFHTDWVLCLAWSPDGKTLISGSHDHSIRTWNTKTWKQLAVLNEHTGVVTGVAISPNGRILASASLDNTVRFWNLDNSQLISSPLYHAQYLTYVTFSADGMLLATGCNDKNAYTWDVLAILKEAGLDELLLDQPDKSLLAAADATQCPVRRPINVSQRIPRGFFDDTPHSSKCPHSLPSPSHSSLHSRLLSFFRPTHPDAHDTPSRPHPFHWVRNCLSARPSGADIELHERPSALVAVPYAKGKRRNASARERRKPIMQRPTASSSRPPNTTVAQQSSDAAQTQSSSQANAAVSTSTTPPVAANTTSNTNPHVTIKHAGRWARFWLFVCCTSPEYTDGHR